MVTDSNETVEVDANATDDLDAFTAEFFGKPTEESVEEVEEVVDTPEEETVVEADADAEEEEVEEEEEPVEEPQPKKNRTTAKERISELTADKRALKEENARLQALLEDKQEPAKVPVVQTKSDEPDPEAKDDNGELKYPLGKFDPDFAADHIRWVMKTEREREAAEAKAVAEVKAQEAAEQELLSNWETKLVATEEVVPDLRDKLASLEGSFADLEPDHGRFLVETIMELDRGPEVLLFLSDNLGVAEAIVAASPRSAVIALGEIHGRLPTKAKTESNKTKVSKAPTPPVTTRGNGGSGKVITGDTDNLEDFEREFFKPRRA
jgi:hypothetical protein